MGVSISMHKHCMEHLLIGHKYHNKIFYIFESDHCFITLHNLTSDFVLKSKSTIIWDALIQKRLFDTMNIDTFQGDLTDTSAKTKTMKLT